MMFDTVQKFFEAQSVTFDHEVKVMDIKFSRKYDIVSLGEFKLS